MKFHTFLLTSLILHSFTALSAQPSLISGHADIAVSFDAQEISLKPHWHLATGSVVDSPTLPSGGDYLPGNLMAQVSSSHIVPHGLEVATGTSIGDSIFLAGSSTYQPNLGLSAEDLTNSDWIGDITIKLTNWTLPQDASFVLFTTDLSGNHVADILFSTHAPFNTFALNSIPLFPGDHMHFLWGFTNIGFYSLELTWEGIHGTEGFIQSSDVFTFHVIPEPSTTTLILPSILTLLILLKRRPR